MAEAYVLLDVDDRESLHPATANAVAGHLKNALREIGHVVSTGSDAADSALLVAEQALRRSLNNIS